MTTRTSDCVRQQTGRADSENVPPAELVLRAQSGDADAFAAIVNDLRPRLLVVLRKRMHGRDDAEDIAQDTFAKAWRNLKSYDRNRSFIAWIYTIALRRATDYLRNNRRRQELTRFLPADETTPPPDTAVHDKDDADNIWRTAREVLSASQYTALWLRYAEELSLAEVAETIGKTHVATRVMLHRARTTLRTQLSHQEQPDD